MGFGIRIDILSQGALFAFKQLATRTLILVGAISQLADEVLKFEKVMADLARLMVISSGTTARLEERMASLGSQILDISTESIFGFQQIAEALSYLMRAGFSTSEAIDELSKSILLATAVGMDLAEASKTIVRLTNMFKYAGQDTTNIVDQLTQSEMLFAMTTEDMNTALNMAGAVAAEAGISLAQLATMIGVLYSAGLNASTAGTVLRRSLAAVLAATGPAEEAIMSLGINMDYFGTLLPLERLQLLASYITAIEHPQTRLNIAFEIFGIRGVNILPVLESMMTNFDSLTLSIQNASDIAQLGADTFEEQLYTKLVMITQAIQNAMVQFGEWSISSAPAFMAAALLAGGALFLLTKGLWANTVATKFSTIAQGLNYTARLSNWAVGNLGIGQLTVETLSTEINTQAKKRNYRAVMKGTLERIKGGVAKIASGGFNIFLALTYGVLSVAVKIATFATKAFVKALGPIALILTIVAAVMKVVNADFGGFGGLLEQFRPFLNQISNLFQYLGQAIMEIAEALMPLVRIILKMFMSQIKFILMPLKMLMLLIKYIVPFIKMMAVLIGDIAQKFMDWVESSGILEKVMKAVGRILKFVMRIVGGIIGVFVRMANVVIRIINRFKKEGEKMELLEVPKPGEAGEMLEAEQQAPPKPPGEELDGEGTVPPEDAGYTGPPPGTGGIPTPTGTPDERVRRTGDGGRGGGGYSFMINVYIVPEMAEFWDEEVFGNSLAKGLALEIKRSRGVYFD